MLLPKRKRGFPVVDFSQIPPASIITEYIKDSAITVNEIAANAITATKILAGTITADRLDAAVLVAGNILISGTIYLSDWAHSSDSEKLDGAVVYTGSIDKTGLNFVAFEKDVDSLDDMAEGATYERVLATDITAGHILLSSVTQSSSYRTVTDANKTTWNGKPDNMDEIGDGATYKKVRATQISAGYIKLTSQTVKTSEWYDESGVEIDATHGINIYGVDSAFTTRATKTGTIQCKVGSSGEILAGAGAVILDAAGLKIKGQLLRFLSNSTEYGFTGYSAGNMYLVAKTSTTPLNLVSEGGDIILSPGSGLVTVLGTILPNSDGAYNLGSAAVRFGEIHSDKVYAADEMYIPAVA